MHINIDTSHWLITQLKNNDLINRLFETFWLNSFSDGGIILGLKFQKQISIFFVSSAWSKAEASCWLTVTCSDTALVYLVHVDAW